jgi:DNA repair protein RadC
MRERVLRSGAEDLEFHEILEFLLYPVIPRRNTNDIAHALISKFGSLANVLNAEADDLLTVPGVTKNAAVFLSALPGIYRAYLRSQTEERPLLSGKDALIKFLKGYLAGRNTESAYLICLDAHNRLTTVQKLGKGSANNVSLDVRDICDVALRQKAVSVILAHNHPSGIAEPSNADINFTKKAAVALKSIDVTLFDHIIMTDGASFSFHEQGMGADINRHAASLLDDDGILYFRRYPWEDGI